MLYASLIIFAAIFMVIALKNEKHIVIIATAILGSYISLRSISWIFGGWPPEMQISNYISDDAYGSLPIAFWYYLGGATLLSLIGMFV